MKKSALVGFSVATLVASALAAPTAPTTPTAGQPRPMFGSRAGRTVSGVGDRAAREGTPGGLATPDGRSGEAYAAAAEETEDRKRDLNFVDASLDLSFEIYGKLIGKTVIKDPSVPETKITLVSLEGQRLSLEEQIEALEATFEMNNIHLEPYGDKFVRAVTRDKARGEGVPVVIEENAPIPNTMAVCSVLIPFKNIPIEEAKTVLDNLKSPKCTSILAYERIGKVLVTDTGINLNIMRRVAGEIDVATPVNENVYVRQIENASATEIKTLIEQIVQESQKELEKSSKAQQNGQQMPNRFGPGSMMIANGPNGTLLRRPNGPNANPQPTGPTVDSVLTNVSDADRGLIRGKVVISADDRSNRLVIITAKANMDFFDKLIKELDIAITPEVQVEVMRLDYADAEDVADMINDLIGNSSSSKANAKGNTNPAARTTSGGSNLTGNRATPTANRNAQPRSGESKTGEISKDNCTVLADKRINGLVVMANKDIMPSVKDIVKKMDVKLDQVLIETCIIEVSLGDEFNTGVDWVLRGREKGVVGSQRQIVGKKEDGELIWEDVPIYGVIRDGLANNGSFGLGGGGGSGTGMLGSMLNAAASAGTNAVVNGYFGGATPIGSGVNYLLKSDKLNLAAVISAAKTDSHSKYLASPVVMTVDNKEATINATKMRYLLKGFQSSGNSYSTIAVPDYEQKEVGIEIKVTPKINPNGTVMLKVEEKYSQISGSQNIKYATGNSSSGGTSALQDVPVPLTVTREMSADVMLENGETVVFGGLTESFDSEAETGIPILKDIPWIGKWLFGKVEHEETRSELLVFMTPYVLKDGKEAAAEAARRKASLSDPNSWIDNEWSRSKLADPMPVKEKLRKQKEIWRTQDEQRTNELALEKAKLDRAIELERRAIEEVKALREEEAARNRRLKELEQQRAELEAEAAEPKKENE